MVPRDVDALHEIQYFNPDIYMLELNFPLLLRQSATKSQAVPTST